MQPLKQGLFEQLKEKRPLSSRIKSPPEPCFQLVFRENRAALQVVDREGHPLSVDYTHYSGSVRRVLKLIERISTRRDFEISRQESSSQIDLANNDFLLWHFRDSSTLIDEHNTPIRFCEQPAELEVSITGENRLTCIFYLLTKGKKTADFLLISENLVLSAGMIYQVSPLGENFSLIPDFMTMILPSELGKYLSLLVSYCDNIGISYKSCHLEEGPQLKTKPALVIEKVCADNSLYLRIIDALPGFDPDFVSQYDLTRVVSVNEIDNAIVVSHLIHAGHIQVYKTVKTHLNRLQKTLDDPDAGYHEEEDLFIIDADLAQQLIYEELPGLASTCMVFGAEDLKRYRVRTLKPELSLSLNHGIEFLEGEIELRFGDESFSLFDALHQYRKKAYIQLSDGDRVLLDRDYVQRLERIFQRKRGRESVSFFDLPLVEELIGEKLSDEPFVQSRKVFAGFNEIHNHPVPIPAVCVELRPYQEEGYRWLEYLRCHRLGGCLADDMGLGKTLQAITLLSGIYPGEARPSLVIIPKSLIYNWQNEFRKFNPDLNVYTYYGSERDIETVRCSQVVITTYGLVRSDIESLRQELFYYIILDESQQIKNINSQISRAVMTLKSENRLALSGTPIENNLGELYALFRFLNPAMFGSLQRFHRHYLTPIQHLGDKTVLLELKKKIFPFILRRLKKDVLQDLPDKIEQVLYVEMAPEQKIFYEQRRAYLNESVRQQVASEGIEKSQFYVLQAITDLRQIASIPEAKSEGLIVSSKRELLMEQILDSVANQHKILLFANFLAILDFLADDLQKEKIDFEIMTGATRDRERRVNRFQNDAACRVFLMTLK
ncbi:DEAD/DEAH box helicase, partial [bacterium]|nr:DEAD/DEAH box helicase [bacterium]